MIRNCQHCGAWFSADEINTALRNKDLLITCRFCGLSNEVGSTRSSNVDSGFERLKMGSFYDASVYFTNAKDEAKRYKKEYLLYKRSPIGNIGFIKTAQTAFLCFKVNGNKYSHKIKKCGKN